MCDGCYGLAPGSSRVETKQMESIDANRMTAMTVTMCVHTVHTITSEHWRQRWAPLFCRTRRGNWQQRKLRMRTNRRRWRRMNEMEEEKENTQSLKQKHRFGLSHNSHRRNEKFDHINFDILLMNFLTVFVALRCLGLGSDIEAAAADAVLSLPAASHHCHTYLSCVHSALPFSLPLSSFSLLSFWQLGISFRFSEHLHH